MFIPPIFLLLSLVSRDVRALLRDSTFLLPVRHAATCWTIIEVKLFLLRAGIATIFCTIPVYGTQKKVAMAGIEPLTRKKVCTTNSHAYQLSQLVHYASADIFKYISTVPLTSSSYFVIFLYLFFSRSIVAIISIIKQLSRPFNQL